MEVEGVVAHAPRGRALVGGIRHLVGLALNARLVNVVLANGAVLNGNIYTDWLAECVCGAYPRPREQLRSIS